MYTPTGNKKRVLITDELLKRLDKFKEQIENSYKYKNGNMKLSFQVYKTVEGHSEY